MLVLKMCGAQMSGLNMEIKRLHNVSDRIVDVLKGITYKEGWAIKIVENNGIPFLQWCFSRPDYMLKGEPISEWKSRKWVLSEHATESELVQTALAAVLMAEEHEAREAFRYRGSAVFNPHIDVEAMASVSAHLDVRDIAERASQRLNV